MNSVIPRSFKEKRVELPLSKSIENRVLILKALAGNSIGKPLLDDPDDTAELKSALRQATASQRIFAGNGGTTFRFLTAYLSVIPGEFELNCGEQMKRRPVGALVNALNELGAGIEYLNEAGYPSLKFGKQKLAGGEAVMDVSVSSQFLSAAAMAAAAGKKPSVIRFSGTLVSQPYFELTLRLMKQFGADFQLKDDVLTVNPAKYSNPVHSLSEPDMTAASYWYSAVALSKDPNVKVFLKGVSTDSLQPDQSVVKLFEYFDVETHFSSGGAELVKSKRSGLSGKRLEFDLQGNPDLAQTVAVTAAGLQKEVVITGLQTLKVKETDRLKALESELKKLNSRVTILKGNTLQIEPAGNLPDHIQVETYGDHRMAMAFAPLCMVIPKVEILNPDVVNKSYPGFWEEWGSL